MKPTIDCLMETNVFTSTWNMSTSNVCLQVIGICLWATAIGLQSLRAWLTSCKKNDSGNCHCWTPRSALHIPSKLDSISTSCFWIVKFYTDTWQWEPDRGQNKKANIDRRIKINFNCSSKNTRHFDKNMKLPTFFNLYNFSVA